MSNKNLAIGFALGLGIGAIVGLLYAPNTGEKTRELLSKKSGAALKRMGSNLKWTLMTPRERYMYLWKRGGSLREWRKGCESV